MPINQIVATDAAGSPYNTVPPNVAGSGAGGNGGAATKSGSVSTLLDNVDSSRSSDDAFGSAVVATDDVNSAGGTLAYNNQKPIAKRVTTEINGTSNTVLQSGASQPDLIQSIHYMKVDNGENIVQGVRTRRFTAAIRAGKFNEFTGQFEAGYPVVAADTFNDDDAATPTRLVPGELVYKTGSYEPVTDEYKEKTG